MSPRLRPWVVGVVLLVVLLVMRMVPLQAVVVSGVVVALAHGWFAQGAHRVPRWPEARVEERDGTRLEVATLSWSFIRRDGTVSEIALRRLRDVAARRLARHGVHLPGGFVAVARGDVDPAVVERGRALLGPQTWDLLARRGGWMPTVNEIIRCVERLEQLDPGSVDERLRT